jgi:hypothetical protein
MKNMGTLFYQEVLPRFAVIINHKASAFITPFELPSSFNLQIWLHLVLHFLVWFYNKRVLAGILVKSRTSLATFFI